MKRALPLLALSSLLPACAAGVDASSPDAQTDAIVNGYASAVSDHPWQVTLQWGGHFCGASIIDAEWVLTANHCVEGIQASSIEVVVGATYLSDGGEQAVGVSQIVRNPGYSEPANGGDAALLKLSPLLSLGGNVQAIDLVTPADASAGATSAGVIANVSGWGTTSSGSGDTPDQLRAVDVVIRSMTEAEQYYGSLSDDQLAAGGDDGDSCDGDSGGPLTVETSHGVALAGVVSWGGVCAAGAPGMYSRVSSLHSWIVDTTGGGGGGGETGNGTWMCDASWNGDGECDCGCGGTDSDCPNATIDDCQDNDCDFWQPTQGLPVDPNDPTQCSGGVDAGEGEEEGGEGEGEGEESGEGEGEESGQLGAAQERNEDEPEDDDAGGCQSAGSAPVLTLLALAVLPLRARRWR